MIENFSLIDKTYENLMEDALYQIPLICKEWTNFNPSDPGVTIVENLSAINILQQTTVNALDETLQFKLMGLVNMVRQRLVSAKVMMSFESETLEKLEIPSHTAFICGDVRCENTRPLSMNNMPIVAVYSEAGSRRRDLSRVLDRNIHISMYVWGEKPEAGEKLYILFASKPEESFTIYVHVDHGKVSRKSMSGEDCIAFAKLTWQVYTENGWESMDVEDHTHHFLYDGSISFHVGNSVIVSYENNACAIRCVMEEQMYDIAPKIHQIIGNVFEVKQQQTMVASYDFPGGKKDYVVSSSLLQDGFFKVYVREADGYFRLYHDCNEKRKWPGMFDIPEQGSNWIKIAFSKPIPEWEQDDQSAVKVVVYSSELIGKDELGEIYAYDHQVLDVGVENIVSENFELLIVQPDQNGEPYFSPAKPDTVAIDGLRYTLEKDAVHIETPGIAGDGVAVISSLVSSFGHQVILRANSVFSCQQEMAEDMTFMNPSQSAEGKSEESLEDMRKRFIADFNRPVTAVMEEDYEVIIKNIPGLAIRKVKAGVNFENNLVKLTVMPYSEERFPMINALYRDTILRNVDQYRLISTKIQLEQPRYVPIEVTGEIYVKAQYKNSKETIDTLLFSLLDYVSLDKNFGEKIIFGEIYNKLEKLQCIEYIYNLSIILLGEDGCTSTGEDIQLGYNELCYLKSTNIKMISQF